MDQTWLLLLNPVILAALAASTHQLHHIVGFVHLFSLYQTVKNKTLTMFVYGMLVLMRWHQWEHEKKNEPPKHTLPPRSWLSLFFSILPSHQGQIFFHSTTQQRNKRASHISLHGYLFLLILFFFLRSWGLQLTPCCTWSCMWSEMDPTEAHSLGDNVGLQRTDLPKLHNASVPEQGLRCGLCVGWFIDGCRGPVVLLPAAGARLFLCLHTLSFPTLGHPAQQFGIFYVNYWLTVGGVDVIYMNKSGGKLS